MILIILKWQYLNKNFSIDFHVVRNLTTDFAFFGNILIKVELKIFLKDIIKKIFNPATLFLHIH